MTKKTNNNLKKVEELLYLADHFYSLGSYEDALYLYQKLLNYPEYINIEDIAIKNAKCYYHLERYNEILLPFRNMRLSNSIKNFLNEIAEELEKKEKFDEAVEILRFLNQHDDLFSEYFREQQQKLDITIALQQGDIFFKKKKFKEGVKQYKLAIQLGYSDWNDLLERFMEYYHEGKDNSNYLLGLASIYLKKKEYLNAIQIFEKLLSKYNNTTLIKKVSDVFQKIDLKTKYNPEILYKKGLFYYKYLSQYEEALKIFLELEKEKEYKEKVENFIARCYFYTNEYSLSYKYYEKIDAQIEDLPILYKLGKHFEENGFYSKALKIYKKIHSINPEYEDISLKIKALELREKALNIETIREKKVSFNEAILSTSSSPLKGVAAQRYEYIDVIGSGGMGNIYKVYDRIYEKVVALKVLHPNLIQKKKSLERFFREAQLCSNLKHPNIIEIFDFGLEPKFNQCYITMEYVDGKSLREVIAEDWKDSNLSVDRIKKYISYAIQILSALEATHKNGIIHRDIKPDNILLNKSGVIKVTDFGIAHIEFDTMTQEGVVMGTPKYMSPEQISGKKLDNRSDIYSAGVVLYELLSGEPPFNIGDIPYQHLHVKPLPLKEIFSVIPEELDRIVLKSLEKDPDNRYHSAREFKNALNEFLTKF